MKKDPDKKNEDKKKRVDEISKMIHPHDDKPDPTANMGNYNFPQMLFCFLSRVLYHVCLGS